MLRRVVQVLALLLEDTNRLQQHIPLVSQLIDPVIGQGHIAAKTLDFDGAVSVTMGLPIIRSSVDHGTAFDIAGKGTASAATMKSAYAAGAKFARYADQAKKTYG